MTYRRLTREERYQIAALIQSGIGVREIASVLKRHASTISREIRRNSYRGYDASWAHDASRKRRANIGPRAKIEGKLEKLILSYLGKDWSPEQIVGRCKLLGQPCVSHETIYKYLYAKHAEDPRLYRHLRRHRRYRKTRSIRRNFKNIGVRRNRTWLDERPKIVDARIRLGDLERDTMVGRRGGGLLLTIVDRVSRLSRIAFVSKGDGRSVHEATLKLLKNEVVATITNDNGAEFALHGETAKELDVGIYFTRPYRSWERGTNENMNGLIRQYFPRGKDIDPRRIKLVEDQLNNRPRKCLGYKTPLEVHRELESSVALSA